jgi:hypothetical protein
MPAIPAAGYDQFLPVTYSAAQSLEPVPLASTVEVILKSKLGIRVNDDAVFKQVH